MANDPELRASTGARIPDGNIDMPAAEKAVRDLLVAIGEDPERPGLVGTPNRVARAWQELLAGYARDPQEYLETQFPTGGGEYVIERDIFFTSLCEHHLLPFSGRAHVAYVPQGNTVTGLSKLARVVQGYARRLQLQEQMTQQIADAVMTGMDARGVLVMTEASHGCMTIRGVQQPGATTVSVAARGNLIEPGPMRTEILAAMRDGRARS